MNTINRPCRNNSFNVLLHLEKKLKIEIELLLLK